jgi:hypothetical protein
MISNSPEITLLQMSYNVFISGISQWTTEWAIQKYLQLNRSDKIYFSEKFSIKDTTYATSSYLGTR